MAAQTTRSINTDHMLGHLRHVVKETIYRRFHPMFLKDMRPMIEVKVDDRPERGQTALSCRIRSKFRKDYVGYIPIDNDMLHQMRYEQDWMHYQAETMARIAQTGVFLSYTTNVANGETMAALNRCTDMIDAVNFIPPASNISRDDQVTERWLAVVTFKNSVQTYRKTIREITEDPTNFAAFLTLVKQ